MSTLFSPQLTVEADDKKHGRLICINDLLSKILYVDITLVHIGGSQNFKRNREQYLLLIPNS